jgi:hypothetical protein
MCTLWGGTQIKDLVEQTDGTLGIVFAVESLLEYNARTRKYRVRWEVGCLLLFLFAATAAAENLSSQRLLLHLLGVSQQF